MLNETYLCFQRRESYYAIDESKVIRILFSKNIYELPVKEDAIKGVVILDDQLVGIVDIESSDHEKYYIVIDIEGEYIGICADEILGYQEIPDDNWISQEDEEYPFCYQDGDMNILYMMPELVKRRFYHD